MKLLPEKKWPVEGEDYGFIDMDGVDKVTSIRILKGKFEGVVYHYGTIEVVEEDPPRIKFDYFWIIQVNLNLKTCNQIKNLIQ